MRSDQYYVYLLRCRDGKLYCGISVDVQKRIEAHNLGRGAKYTRSRTPVTLVISVGPMTKSEALKLEIETKKLRKWEKWEHLSKWSSKLS